MSQEVAAKKGMNRKLHINVLRILAILFVVYNHTGKTGYVAFANEAPGGISFWILVANSIVISQSAWLFFCISGVLLLSRPQESLKNLYIKRVLKYVLVTIGISIVYAVANHLQSGTEYTLESFLLALYSGNIRFHLW